MKKVIFLVCLIAYGYASEDDYQEALRKTAHYNQLQQVHQ